MEKFATITCSRDRPKMLAFCCEQLDKQTLQPDERYFIDFDPADSQPDLTKRIRSGIELAQSNGIDLVIVIEDDDLITRNHLETMVAHIGDADFVGYNDTYYYSIRSKTWRHQYHEQRSSLFTTGFRISALKDFRWPPDHYLWLDVKLWEFARDTRKKVKLMEGNPCLGIKGHGEGSHAGKSHKLVFEHPDYDMNFLRKRTEDYQYEFYKNWKV